MIIFNGLSKILKVAQKNESEPLTHFTDLTGTTRLPSTITSTTNPKSSWSSGWATAKSSLGTLSLLSSQKATSTSELASCLPSRTRRSSLSRKSQPLSSTRPSPNRSHTTISSWCGATLTSESSQARTNCTQGTRHRTVVTRREETRIRWWTTCFCRKTGRQHWRITSCSKCNSKTETIFGDLHFCLLLI